MFIKLANMYVVVGLMFVVNAFAIDMPVIAKTNNCVSCHAIDKKSVGPAFVDIAKKYNGVKFYEFRGKVYPLIDGMMMKVSLGGAGNWGSMVMGPSDQTGIRQEQIKELVKFVLGLAKE